MMNKKPLDAALDLVLEQANESPPAASREFNESLDNFKATIERHDEDGQLL